MKHKYEEKKILEIIGLLEENEDGELVVFVDNEQFLLADVLRSKLGTEITFKFVG